MKPAMPLSTRAAIFAILAAACIVFLPSIGYQFTNWDDDIYVVNNPAIRQLSPGSVALLFRPTAEYMYHPLTMVTYSIDWQAGGGTAWTFHATNILLHLLNVVLVFFLLKKLSMPDGMAIFITAVFALHPLQVESVAWISARKELLYAFFYLASLAAYLRSTEKKSPWFYATALFLFACALFSKPTAVTLPAAIFLIELWKSKKVGAKSLYKLIPFLIGTAAYSLFFLKSQSNGALPPLKYYSLFQQSLLFFYQVAFYIVKAVFPVNLSSCYAYPQLAGHGLPWTYYAAPFLLALIVIPLWLLRKRPVDLFAGLIFYVVALSPVLQVIPFNNASLVADRYCYLPILGIALFLYQLFELAESRISVHAPETPIPKALPEAVFVLCLFVISLGRVGVWKNSVTLFDDVIEKNDRINIAYGNRANARIQAGNFAGALEDCVKLLGLDPGNAKAFYNKGNAESGLERYREAVNDYSRSIALGYLPASVFYNRGTAYYHLGFVDSALADYRLSRTRDDRFADAPYSIGYIILHDRKDPLASLSYFEAALAINPDHTEAMYQKAIAEYSLRLLGSAMSDLAAAVGNQPGLKCDSMVTRINSSIDSVNVTAARLTELIDKAPGKVQYLEMRRALFITLGDSTRASLDQKIAAQYSSKHARP